MSTAQGATRTTTASGTAVAAATWLRVEVVVNAAASSAEFFVDGVSLGTVATNIPSGTQKTGVGFRIHKSTGATARTLEVDYVHARCEFTSAR